MTYSVAHFPLHFCYHYFPPLGIFIVAAKRTPFGKYGGAFKDVFPADLLAVAAKDALKAGNVAAEVVDTVNIGQVYGVSLIN